MCSFKGRDSVLDHVIHKSLLAEALTVFLVCSGAITDLPAGEKIITSWKVCDAGARDACPTSRSSLGQYTERTYE